MTSSPVKSHPVKLQSLPYFILLGLLDATLDLGFGNISDLETEIDAISKWDVIDGRPWINWNMKFLKHVPLSHAALAFQMLLPGNLIS